jgi:hypothetical protein
MKHISAFLWQQFLIPHDVAYVCWVDVAVPALRLLCRLRQTCFAALHTWLSPLEDAVAFVGAARVPLLAMDILPNLLHAAWLLLLASKCLLYAIAPVHDRHAPDHQLL